MITLLMVLFIVLFSISQVDLKKFEQFKDGLNEFGNGGGQASLIELNSAGLLTGGQMAQLEEAQRALDEETTQEAAAANEACAARSSGPDRRRPARCWARRGRRVPDRGSRAGRDHHHRPRHLRPGLRRADRRRPRSEEHTSEPATNAH